MRHQPFGADENPTDDKSDTWGGGPRPPQQ